MIIEHANDQRSAAQSGADYIDARFADGWNARKIIDELTKVTNARIRTDRDAATMRWRGINVSCTGGAHNLLRAWAAKARAALPEGSSK